MLIYLDDVSVDLEGNTLGELLQSASTKLRENGRIVAEVQIDGQVMTPGDLDKAQAEPVTGQVRLVSTDASKLALDVLEQVQVTLGESKEIMQEAADLFQQDRVTDAMQKIGQSMQVWQHVQQAVTQSATLMRINLDELEYEGKSIGQWSDELLEKFQQLRAGLEASDTVALSDALSYEWPQQIEHWQGILGRLMARIQSEH